MEFKDKLYTLADKVSQQAEAINTEEATKTAFIMPFIHNVLGYDIFDPTEVIPEYTADVGTKKGEKVDYAILKDGEMQILIECKKIGEPLNLKYASQLYRYFSVTNARIAILTNGQEYQFFTDLDSPNKMDSKPFLELDLADIDEHTLPELGKLTKQSFDLDAVISTAGELKYLSLIKKVIAQQLSEPDEDFIKVFASRTYEGILTKSVKEQFYTLTKRAFTQYINDSINERLKSALRGASVTQPEVSADVPENIESKEKDIVTTVEEMEGFHIVKAIGRELVEVQRIVSRDTKSYFGILLDDNNRKPICRLHFNRTQKYIGFLDDDKKETRHPINSIDELYSFSAEIKSAIKKFTETDNC